MQDELYEDLELLKYHHPHAMSVFNKTALADLSSVVVKPVSMHKLVPITLDFRLDVCLFL